jgi:DmsE family decaheme c-type cytochrome
MGRRKGTLGPAISIAGAVALWLVAVATISARPPAPGAHAAVQPVATAAAPAVEVETATAAVTAQATGAGYAGQDVCMTCHTDKTLNGTPHGMSGNPNTPAAKENCESCHGPGQAHVDGGGDKTKIKTFTALSATEANAVCTTCHNSGPHMMWDSSAHENRGVACTTCHSVHSFKSDKAQLKKATISETCATCHRDKVLKLKRSAHMPVQSDPNRPAAMECTSCHNPHGSTNVSLLKVGTSPNDTCVSCHPEKRGPYLWEHAAVVDSCTNCHDPHGSSFDRMLVTRAPMLCQRCHVTTRHPPTVYDNYARENATSANRVLGRSCVACHQAIHGSNAASGEFFLR